jgi:Arc/MetJ family transcription regulator
VKITTYIDERLLAKAMRAIKAGSQREAIEAGLRHLLSDVERKLFVKEFSQYHLTWTSRKLSQSRA